MSATAVQFARGSLGLTDVHQGRVQDSGFAPASFDVITLWDVIEHIPEPDDLLSALAPLLTDDGFVFLHTPNAAVQLPKARLKKAMLGMREGSHYLEARDHVHIYSMSTLAAVLGRNGLRDVRYVHLPPIQSVSGDRSRTLAMLKNAWCGTAAAVHRLTLGAVNLDNLFAIARRAAAVALLAGTAACEQWLTQPIRYNTVEVTATRRNGEPLPAVGLELYTGQRPMGYGATDVAGRHVFERVPDGQYGVRALLPPGYAAVEELIAGPPSTVVSGLDLADNAVTPVRFTFLRRGPGAVDARVVDETGAGVPGVFVTLYAPSQVRDSVVTDSEGRVRFDPVPFGVHGLSLPVPALYRFGDEPFFRVRDGLLVEDGVVDTATVVLTRCIGTVTVTVREADGTPVSDFPLVLYRATGIVEQAATDASGARAFGPLPCDEYGVQLTQRPGWTFDEGRSLSFVDGLRITRTVVSYTPAFVVRRTE
jgi:hypothetical protein